MLDLRQSFVPYAKSLEPRLILGRCLILAVSPLKDPAGARAVRRAGMGSPCHLTRCPSVVCSRCRLWLPEKFRKLEHIWGLYSSHTMEEFIIVTRSAHRQNTHISQLHLLYIDAPNISQISCCPNSKTLNSLTHFAYTNTSITNGVRKSPKEGQTQSTGRSNARWHIKGSLHSSPSFTNLRSRLGRSTLSCHGLTRFRYSPD